jgi:D-3-phosphoglycerate dehydrogenase / 2-oxoglutarate reductase
MTNAKPRLLLTEAQGMCPTAIQKLQERFAVVEADLSRAELIQQIADYEYVWVKLRHQIDAEVLQAAKQLRVLGTNTTGLTHIDIQLLQQRGIKLLSLQGETEFLQQIRATAELTVGLILGVMRKIPAAHQHVVSGGWDRDLFAGRELHNKTAGIIGYGRLGRIVARYLRAFDMRVLVTSPHLTQADCEPGITAVSLDQLLSQSQIVSLHANVTATNHRMLSHREFQMMPRGAWFINTARGELVDSSALLTALESGHLAGAALDVLDEERSTGMANHPLVRYAQQHANLLLTPHIGGKTPESAEKTELFLTEKFCRLLD